MKKLRSYPLWHLLLIVLFILSVGGIQAEPLTGAVTAANSVIGGLAGDQIGSEGVVELPSGNIVIVSPNWNGGIGAVTCLTPAEYRAGNVVISAANSLIGSAVGNAVGGGITVLENGNYVVRSPNWDNGATINVGAVTWVNGTTCIPANEVSRAAVVSATNSLIGSTADDSIGNDGVAALTNGHYVVISSRWDNGLTANVGAATWGNGTTGIVGAVSTANSLYGTTADDQVGFNGVLALENGNYVVRSEHWDNGLTINVGAATWGNGTTGIVGAVSTANSLYGTTASDRVGAADPVALTNGNYVVRTPSWNNGGAANAGAVTLANGTTGIIGPITSSNSLVGTVDGDRVGTGVVELANGHYVVRSPNWDNGAVVADVGAVTWVNGTTGMVGAVTSANSLTGTTLNDRVGLGGVVALTNGHYVVISHQWNNGGATEAGAVTWMNGTLPTSGTVTSTNSLVGISVGDRVGNGDVTALENGHYVVSSRDWDNGGITQDVGAFTWGNGATGVSGPITTANSLIGTLAGDGLSSTVTALTNGNYVIGLPLWDNSSAANAGAVTWGNGNTGVFGTINAGNSLVGVTGGDRVGNLVRALENGNYVVGSPEWDNSGVVTNVGAATWGSGTSGIVGVVSAANSLIGSIAEDRVGNGVVALANGNYVVRSPNWDNGSVVDAGAVTWGYGVSGTVGVVGIGNSLAGTTASDNVGGVTELDYSGGYLIRSPNWDNGLIADVGAVTYSESDTELLANLGFEEKNPATPAQPLVWVGKRTSQDRLKCNTTTVMFARTGLCAYRFKGSALEAVQLNQGTEMVSELTSGLSLNASVYYKTNLVAPLIRVKLKVFYAGQLLPKVTTGTIDTVSASYTRFALPSYTIESGAAVTRIKLQFINRSKSGKLYIDDVSLTYNAIR